MPRKTLGDIAKDMAGIDIAILSTHTEGGEIAKRRMSNNGEVAYDGTSSEQTRVVVDIRRDPKVAWASPPKVAFSRTASMSP
ncbi:hypothetical protein [Bradyrhizobium liaoningense]|uniref:hypothetical protein n=1 Tax=Bradyrhizobium liaoningense TaxID=43992 RepID=UPI0020110B9E|nr:hypothetical protein [Bradyrhizobium liaoningense]